MTSHAWVKHTITPVHILHNDDGQAAIFVDPDDQALSEENAAYGCMNCDLPLVEENYDTECEGAPSEVVQD